jgi:hypothetical protein
MLEHVFKVYDATIAETHPCWLLLEDCLRYMASHQEQNLFFLYRCSYHKQVWQFRLMQRFDMAQAVRRFKDYVPRTCLGTHGSIVIVIQQRSMHIVSLPF